MDIQGYLETVRLLPRKSKCDEEALTPLSSRSEDKRRLSIILVLVALGFMYSVHNLIAPNMTAIAKNFHFDNYERDAYIGGELTLFFYFPGVFGALFAGALSGIVDRRSLLVALAILTSLACLLTARVATFRQLAWARAMTGLGIGGSLPVVYSLIGDWFPPKQRASATAYVTAASGAGVFVGQCVATLTGSVDWRWPFIVIAIPSAATGLLIWSFAEEPVRGGKEDGIETESLYQNGGLVPVFPTRQLRAMLHNKTNLLVILQAFPGNIPWGVIIVYIHDFLTQDLELSKVSALGSITVLAGAAFFGVLAGGFVGEYLYGTNSKYIPIFGGVCNIARAIPFFIIFGWTSMFGPLARSSEGAFFLLLVLGGFSATMGSACQGAMLLNVNLPEVRGSVMAMYSVLDDLSKGFGTLFVSMIVPLVGGRAIAYQLSLLIWVFTGFAFLYTWYTFGEDEAAMRKNLDEAAKESMVLMAKQRAQQAIRGRAKAAGAAHSVAKTTRTNTGYWPSKPAATDSNSMRPLGDRRAADLANQRDRVRQAARAAAEAMARGR
jgi:MFS family permease